MKTIFRIFAILALLFCLCLTTFAVVFSPSIEAKNAPEIVKVKFNGTPVAALFVDDNGNVLDGVPSFDADAEDNIMELVVVSYSDILKTAVTGSPASDTCISAIFDGVLNAIEQIQAVPNVADLCEGLDEQIQNKIDEFFWR